MEASGREVPCVGTYLVETRQSQSVDSVLDDFASATVNTCGTVVINKVAVGGNGTFNYTGTGAGIDSAFSITTSGGSGSKTFATDVELGIKTVTEQVPAGWIFKSLTCSDPDNGSSVSGPTATIDVDAGETITCTYTNELQAPALSITKVATEESFDAVGDVIHYTIVATNTGNVTLTTVTVTDPQVTGLVCTPANGSSLAPGAAMTCTATHTVTQADLDAGQYPTTACVDDGAGGAAQVCADVTCPASRVRVCRSRRWRPRRASTGRRRDPLHDRGDQYGERDVDGVTVTDPRSRVWSARRRMVRRWRRVRR